MNANQIVARVIHALDEHNIPYMLVGAFSANAFGVERSTHDADFVVELGDGALAGLTKSLAPDIVVEPQLSFESVTLTQRYIATHVSSSFKIEFFLLADEPFHQERFRRRLRGRFMDGTAWVQSPEDLIVQKLRWYGRVKRNKDIDDVRNVIAVQLRNLDLNYIRRWCDTHGTRDLFEKLWNEAQEFQ